MLGMGGGLGNLGVGLLRKIRGLETLYQLWWNVIPKLVESIERLWITMRFKGERRILHVLSAYSTNQVLKIKKKTLDRKTTIRTVNSKTDVERKNYNWRQQHWLTCINRNIKKVHWSTWSLWFKQQLLWYTKATELKRNLETISFPTFQQNRILHSNVLTCPKISDHDATYITANMAVDKFETRYKYIRNLKNFKLEKYVQDFQTLSISLLLWWSNRSIRHLKQTHFKRD